MGVRQKAKLVKTACQACHCECGVIVEVRDGRVVHIEGDPDHPENEGIMCPKGLSYNDLLYHPDRLQYPLKRGGKRGQGKFERISWDEALDTVAREFNKPIFMGAENATKEFKTGDEVIIDFNNKVIKKI